MMQPTEADYQALETGIAGLVKDIFYHEFTSEMRDIIIGDVVLKRGAELIDAPDEAYDEWYETMWNSLDDRILKVEVNVKIKRPTGE